MNSHILLFPGNTVHVIYVRTKTHFAAIALDKIGILTAIFSHLSQKTFVVGTHWKRLNETLPMSSTTSILG